MPLRAKISTISVPATSQDLTTLAVIKDELELKDIKSDDFLKRQISWASAAAANYCNRVFVVETIIDQFWPARDDFPTLIEGVEPLQLSRFPLGTVSAVVENSVTLTAGTDFLTIAANGTLQRLDGNSYPTIWPALYTTVTFQAGYAVIPADIADAVIRLIKMRWFARKRDPMLRSESIPGVRDVAYWVATGDDAGAMPPEIVDLLNNYRVPTVAG